MYIQQILYTNTNKVCYLQFLLRTSHKEMRFVVMSLITQQNCISGNQLMKMAKTMLQYQGPYISGTYYQKQSYILRACLLKTKYIKKHYLEIQNA